MFGIAYSWDNLARVESVECNSAEDVRTLFKRYRKPIKTPIVKLEKISIISLIKCRAKKIEIFLPPAEIWPPEYISPDGKFTHDPIKRMAFQIECPSGRILREVCKKHNLTLKELREKIRTHKVVYARHEAMYRLRRETTFSFPMITRVVGLTDHTSSIHGVRAHARRKLAAWRERQKAHTS